MNKILALVAAAAGLSLASGQVHASCAPQDNGTEPSLQASLDLLLGTGILSATHCASSDAHWVSSGQSSATILLELAGFLDTNRFGIYDAASGQRLQVFSGSADANDQKALTFTGVAAGTSVSVNGVYRATFASPVIGFYLQVVGLDGVQSTDPYYYSDSAVNAEATDHLLAYQGTGTSFLGSAAVPARVRNTVFAADDYLLAWEDLPGSSSDRDYQDFVVLVRDLTPVPLPAAAWLLLSGLLGMLTLRRRVPSA